MDLNSPLNFSCQKFHFREMSMTNKKVVIFDLGNVLIRWDPRNLYRSFFGTNQSEMEWFLTHVCNASWNEMHDAGRLFADGIRELSQTFPDYSAHIEAYFSRWPEMLGGPIEDNVRVLRTLKSQGRPVYALTNWSHETFPFALERYDFLSLFDGIVMSGEERLIKPDPKFYQLLLGRYHLNAGECIFIDDSLANIRTAQSLGIAAIHYHGTCDVQAALESFGFLRVQPSDDRGNLPS
jgi:2-haloacid dehalogenase